MPYEDLDYLIKVSGHFSVCGLRTGGMQMVNSANTSPLELVYIRNQKVAWNPDTMITLYPLPIHISL
jgi:hypothetical protein